MPDLAAMKARRTESPSRPGGSLRADAVTVRFDGVTALSEVSLRLGIGEILGLIGPNGAGKTTLINVLSGFQRPSSGTVGLDDEAITRYSPQRRARRGIVRTFQSVRLFEGLPVYDNVALGATGVGMKSNAAEDAAWQALDTVGLADKADELPTSLPHGSERLVGIARAIAAQPSFLLLDEPAAGLNDAETDELLATLTSLRRKLGIGLLIVEHNMRVIMSVCDRIQTLDRGQTLAVGSPEEIQSNHEVRESYLGTGVTSNGVA